MTQPSDEGKEYSRQVRVLYDAQSLEGYQTLTSLSRQVEGPVSLEFEEAVSRPFDDRGYARRQTGRYDLKDLLSLPELYAGDVVRVTTPTRNTRALDDLTDRLRDPRTAEERTRLPVKPPAYCRTNG